MRWIDYPAVRRAVSLAQVFELVRFEPLRDRRGQLRGACPLVGCPSASRACFAADLSRDVWYCFGCARGGDQLAFYSLATERPLYRATLTLCQQVGIPVPYLHSPPTHSHPTNIRPATR